MRPEEGSHFSLWMDGWMEGRRKEGRRTRVKEGEDGRGRPTDQPANGQTSPFLYGGSSSDSEATESLDS